MNRRTFFKLMGLGGVATAAAVSLPSLLTPKPAAYSTYIMGRDAVTFVNDTNVMAPLTLADIRACVEQLKSCSVLPPKDGQFIGWVHPDRADEVAEWIRYKWRYQWS